MRGWSLLSKVIFYNPIVDAEVAKRLIALNKAFYQKLAFTFSATRSQLQAGVKRVLGEVPMDANILDLGCGNGGVARELGNLGHTGRYVGMDFSEELLKVARLKVEGTRFSFAAVDLTSPDWNLKLPIANLQFDFIFAFAVLHHIPNHEIRVRFLEQVHERLASPTADGSETRPFEGGHFVLSNWQFLNSPKLKGRIQPWEKIGLSDSQVDEGDYLLDWRSGGEGLRYVHHFDTAELKALAKETGFQVADEFLSDGKPRNLALYQIWTPEKM
jgi:SAM-dependent methyltransferase